MTGLGLGVYCSFSSLAIIQNELIILFCFACSLSAAKIRQVLFDDSHDKVIFFNLVMFIFTHGLNHVLDVRHCDVIDIVIFLSLTFIAKDLA
jgi:hypothetical protein